MSCFKPSRLRRCSFHGRRSLSGPRKLEAGIPSSSSVYLRPAAARAFTPQQSSTGTSNSAGDLWTCYAISTCYGRKAPAAAGRALRDAPGPAPHGHGAISGQILYRRACSQFSSRSKWSFPALLDSRLSRASPAIICAAPGVCGPATASARQDNKKRPW